jgi:two-component system sensor histidine kinase BarA
VKPPNVPQKQTNVPENLLAVNYENPDFLKSISHEMRTPLNVIIGICQFLERDRKTPLSPMHRDAVDRMDRNAHALLQSVNRLLSSIRNGKVN